MQTYKNPRELPIYQQRKRILDALESHQVVIVESPTGSGKTTQLPVILHEARYGKNAKIGITQPRRIAAVSVSEYIAKQLDTEVPGLVGYKMRFEDNTDLSTRIKVMTDGILLQEMKADYMLTDYNVIMVDEAHERSLNIDFILGLLKRILEARKDFKVIVSSATINAEVFSHYFGSAPVVRVDAPMYPVEIKYQVPEIEGNQEELIYKIRNIVGDVLKSKYRGDILIFLSGEAIIKDCVNDLSKAAFRKELYILPLYGRLSKEEQERVFPPPPEGKVKVVVATNIAETSITIDGITCVIDPGLAKVNYYNPKTFTESLVEGPISKASCNQRRGRAGRTREGVCYRLYSKEDYESRSLFTLEEIYRTDLSEVVLRMAELGIKDFESFDFISPPGKRGIHGAVETLMLLDALDSDHNLSEIGKRMAQFPLLPKHSRMIVESFRRYPEVLAETIIATAFLSTKTPFLLPQGEEMAARKAHHSFRDGNGDFVSYLKIFNAFKRKTKKEKFCEQYYLDPQVMYEILNVAEQLEQITGDMNIPIEGGGPVIDYLCSISKGLIQFVCRRSGRNTYSSLTAEKIQIHPGSVMFQETPEFIVAGEIVRTSKMWARSVSPLKKEWLSRISPELSTNLYQGKKKAKQKRDTNWQINIGPKTFALKPFKGKKKIAVLPWTQIRGFLEDEYFVLPSHLNNVKGKVVYKDFELFVGDKLSRIFKICTLINPEKDIDFNWPKGKKFDSYRSRPEICKNLIHLMKLCKLKKSKNRLGLISFNTDGSGLYWFKCSRNFGNAVTESFAALESLTDELSEEMDQEPIERLNSAYRKLSEFIEI